MTTTARAYGCSRCLREIFAHQRPQYCATCGTTNSMRALELAAAPELATVDAGPRAPSVTWASSVRVRMPKRLRTGFAPWERVTGGQPLGMLALLGGQRGTGKTRLSLYVAAGAVANMKRPVVHCPLEQKIDATRAYLEILGLSADGIALHDDPDWESIAALARHVRPALLTIDALKLVRIAGKQARANMPAEQQFIQRLRVLLEELPDMAVLATLHNQASQQGYSVGSDVLQLCEVIARLDRAPLESVSEARRAAAALVDKDALIVRLSIDEKNRWGPTHATAELATHARGLVPLD